MIKRITAIIMLLGCLIILVAKVHAADWYNSNWSYRKKITIPAGNITGGPHSDFPLLISITNVDLAARAQSDGSDILFTSSNGSSKLSHEIEQYIALTGELVAWVKAPSVSSAADTDIYMYYGDTNHAVNGDQWETDGSTWDSDFLMIQHLQESPNDTVAGHIDSTSNSHTFRPFDFQDGGGGSTNAAGKIGGADNFAGDNDYLASSGFDSVIFEDYYPAAWTFSAWFKTSDISTLYTEGRNASVSFVTIALNASGSFHSRGHCTNWTSIYSVNSNATGLNDNTWRHVAMANNAGNMDIYIDGAFDKNYTYTPVTCTIAISFSTIGSFRRNGNSGYWNGFIDEVRASKTKRSGGWIKTGFDNQNNPGAFLDTTAAEENTFTWDGSASSDWSTPANWDMNAVPGTGHTVIITSAGSQPVTLTAAATVADLTVNPGATIDLNGQVFTATGTVSNSGIIVIDGSENISWTLDTSQGIHKYDGNGTTGLAGGNNYFGLTFDNVGQTWSLDNTLYVNGTLNIDAGMLNTNGQTIRTAGDVIIGVSGSVNNSTGIWIFDGTTNFTDNSSTGPQNLGTVMVD